MSINRTDAIERPIAHNRHISNGADGNEPMLAVVLMIAGIGGIGAIITQYKHMAGADRHLECEGTRLNARLQICGFVDGDAVDGNRLARTLACDHITRHPDQTLDQIIAFSETRGFLGQPLGGIVEHHDVAALETEEARRQLAGDDTVAGLNGVHHRAGGYGVAADQQHTHQQHDQNGHPAPECEIAPGEYGFPSRPRALRRTGVRGKRRRIDAMIGHRNGMPVTGLSAGFT